MVIIIVGLGPGDPRFLTQEACEVLSAAREIYARTARHPTLAGLPAELPIHTFDSIYEQAASFSDVYAHIVERVLALGRRPDGVVYAVPGHPLVGEATVTAILEYASEEGLDVRIVAGLSFVEPVLCALRLDGLTGIQLIDALDVSQRFHPPLNPDIPALLGQLFSRELASEVKLTLMNQYPDEHPVRLVHAAGTAEQLVESIPLHSIDHSRQIAHLTSLFVPPLHRTSGFENFQETVARLRSPGGCPWDQQQTHQSLRKGLVEETSEVLDALDTGDMASLCEELGDLLLHVVMHAQIATEEGDFTAADVVAGIESKIRRRHPHVFGESPVDNVEQVLTTWEEIKRQENAADSAMKSVLEGVPSAMPALAQASALGRRAMPAGNDWINKDQVANEVNREWNRVLAADSCHEQEDALGDLLFALVQWAQLQGLDAETSLRMANRRFRQRFRSFECALQSAGKSCGELNLEELREIWGQVEPGE